MKYLALLKSIQKNELGTALTEPTKPSSGGFVSATPHPLNLKNEPEHPSETGESAALSLLVGIERACPGPVTPKNEPENGPPLALTEPTKPGFVSFGSITPPPPQTILQREEAGAWSWLRRLLGWDTLPVAGIREAAEDAGVSWQIVQRCAADRVIVSHCGGYWKRPKPPQWTSETPAE